MARPRVALLLGALALAGAAPVRADDAEIARALLAALPADGRTDVVLVDQPSRPGAPRVREATRVNARPEAVRAALLDTTHYGAIIPSLIRCDTRRDAAGLLIVAWELEVPLFNLSGQLAVRAAGDQVRLDLFDGDFAPGHVVFTIDAAAGGGTTLLADASMDVRRSTWLLRRLLKHSPFGEPAAMAAAAYVALRGVALRVEHPSGDRAWRSGAPPGPPPEWQPDPHPLAAAGLASARASGVVALVARRPDERLAGVSAADDLARAPAALEPVLRDPRTWRAFPGLHEVDVVATPRGPGARIADDLPLVELDATYAPADGPLRWVAIEGPTRGARLGWTILGAGGRGTLAALSLYPRLEATGSIPRRFLRAEPLLGPGLALAFAFADVASYRAALDGAH